MAIRGSGGNLHSGGLPASSDTSTSTLLAKRWHHVNSESRAEDALLAYSLLGTQFPRRTPQEFLRTGCEAPAPRTPVPQGPQSPQCCSTISFELNPAYPHSSAIRDHLSSPLSCLAAESCLSPSAEPLTAHSVDVPQLEGLHMEICAARETHGVEGVARVAATLKQVVVEPNREVARTADTQTLRAA